jgi:hypothetical protein
MVFSPTPPVNKSGATPFSFAAIEALAAAAAGTSVVTAAAIALTSPPTAGAVGTVLAIAGVVTPSGSVVQVGLSSSATVAPTSWTAATVNGGTWSAIITPSAAGTYYIWAEQTNNTNVRAVSAAVNVSGGTSAPTITNTYGSTYTWAINPAFEPATTYSAATNGAAAYGTPTTSIPVQFTLTPADATSGDTAHMFWTTTAPTTIPTSGESGVAYGNGGNTAALINSGSALAAYACAPNVAGTYYLSAWIKSSSGTVQGGIVLSPITVT